MKAGDGVNTLILSTDGNYCLNGGADGRVELRDAWTLDLLHTFPKCDTGTGLKLYFALVRHHRDLRLSNDDVIM